MTKETLKSIAAVACGFLVVIVLSVVTDAILEKLSVFSSADQGLYVTWKLLLATAYRTLYTIAGGYVTAKLAPNQPMRHATILGILGILGGLIGLITSWDKGLGPHWYPIALVVLAYPSVWLGGKLKTHR